MNRPAIPPAHPLPGVAHVVIALQPDGRWHLQSFCAGGFDSSYALLDDAAILAALPRLFGELRQRLAEFGC